MDTRDETAREETGAAGDARAGPDAVRESGDRGSGAGGEEESYADARGGGAADGDRGDDAPVVDEAALLAALEQLDYAAPPELVTEMAAHARRGRDVAALAAEGSGKEVLYALAAAERADPTSPSVQALVLAPTREGAIRAGKALHLLGAPAGLEALAWLPWSRRDEEGGRPFAQLLAGRPGELLPQVRAGRLKLSGLRLVAIDGASALEATGQWEAAASLLETLPAEVQKIVTDVERGERLDDLVTHQMGRARTWPRELFGRRGSEPSASGPPLLAAAGGDEEERIDRLADALRHTVAADGHDRAAILCRDGDAAHRVAASLAARGLRLTDDPSEPGIVVAWGDEAPPDGAVRVLYGLPATLDAMRRWLEDGPARAAVVATGELAQLGVLARRAGWRVRAVPEPPPPEALDTVERFRERVRDRLRAERDGTEALVLEPLLREHGGARVAAALSGLLRESGTSEAEGAPEETARERRPSEPERGEGPRRTSPEATRPGAGWMRLYINAGERDEVGPGDLVGAITGETSAVGGQIGRIDIRHSYSLVDVDPEVADEVMDRLTGATIKGREVVARPDRKS